MKSARLARRLLTSAFLLASASVSFSAHALDYKTVGAAPAIMYDAPSEKGRRVFVAPRGMPVEVVLTYGEWSKVRDAVGSLSWVQSKMLTAKHNVMVTAANAKIHAAPQDASPVVFSADKNVLLEVAEPAVSGWLKVKHRDGQSGYVKITEVWGS
ncbi:MAG TPA: SH3 domain-containing protein [Herbaspirillum sp.]|jgi:SH3-like domain-containing protein|nr:SH3 domain-containing protein [Herbaspirillum sp.]